MNVTERVCPNCKKEYKGFRDQESIDEYRISLSCQDCQDLVFGKREDAREPIGLCANCGNVSYYAASICSDACWKQYSEYLNLIDNDS